MASTKWHPGLLSRQRLKQLAVLMFGASASNREMSAAIQFLIGVCEEQRKLSVKHGIDRAKFREMNAGDPDLADLMQPVGTACKANEIVGNTELERGRFTLSAAMGKSAEGV